MSQKTKAKKISPIEVSEQPQRIKGITLDVGAFRFDYQEFVNLEDGSEVKGKMWKFIASASLVSIQRQGRKIVEQRQERVLIKNTKGEVVDTVMQNKAQIVGKSYGYKALSEALSAILPISEEQTKKLIEQAKRQGLGHAIFVRKSDLVPTSPDRYEGKNEWLLMARYPKIEIMESRINQALKASGSPLRVKSGLKWKLEE